jgi:hypothetical protein
VARLTVTRDPALLPSVDAIARLAEAPAPRLL